MLANKADVGQNGEGDDEDEQDREIEVTDDDIQAFEKTHNLKVLKTSAKAGFGVDEAFLEMTKTLIKKQNSMSADERKRQQESGKLGSHKGLAFGKKNQKGGAQEQGGCCQ